MCSKNFYFSFDYLESPTYPVNENKVAKYVEILKVNVNMEMYLKKPNNDLHFWIFENLFPLALAFSRKDKKDPPQIKSLHCFAETSDIFLLGSTFPTASA